MLSLLCLKGNPREPLSEGKFNAGHYGKNILKNYSLYRIPLNHLTTNLAWICLGWSFIKSMVFLYQWKSKMATSLKH